METSSGNVIEPTRALPKKYVEPILYLADRMATADKDFEVHERRIIDDLASAANKKGFRNERWFKDFTEKSACDLLDIEAAKRAALVVLALVLKSDSKRKPEEHEFFTRVRTMLGTAPVTVPVDLETHRQLALKYLIG